MICPVAITVFGRVDRVCQHPTSALDRRSGPQTDVHRPGNSAVGLRPVHRRRLAQITPPPASAPPPAAAIILRLHCMHPSQPRPQETVTAIADSHSNNHSDSYVHSHSHSHIHSHKHHRRPHHRYSRRRQKGAAECSSDKVGRQVHLEVPSPAAGQWVSTSAPPPPHPPAWPSPAAPGEVSHMHGPPGIRDQFRCLRPRRCRRSLSTKAVMSSHCGGVRLVSTRQGSEPGSKLGGMQSTHPSPQAAGGHARWPRHVAGGVAGGSAAWLRGDLAAQPGQPAHAASGRRGRHQRDVTTEPSATDAADNGKTTQT